MDIIGTIGIAGFAFAATAIGGLIREQQTDVLRGPYIEGRETPDHLAAILDQAWARLEPFAEQLSWKARNAIYLASLA
jgi:hypothetical protein